MTFPPCAVYSRQINEPLAGSIGQADVYFLLEANAPFGGQALAESTVPPAVVQHLAQMPHSNCVLIRQPERPADRDSVLTFFAVNVQTHTLYRLQLNAYTDLLAVDLAALLAGQVTPAATEPVHIICTNGKRDVCCATFGVAFYQALQAIEGDRVWQCSHIGGHRFAATGITFPQALAYGRLDLDHAAMWAEYTRQGSVYVEKLRGDLRYGAVEQTADALLRTDQALDSHTGLVHVSSVPARTGWLVTFAHNDQRWQVQLVAGSPFETLSSTTDTQLKRITPWVAHTIQQLDLEENQR